MRTPRDSAAGQMAGDTDEGSVQSTSRDLLGCTTAQNGSSTSAPPFDSALSAEIDGLQADRDAVDAGLRAICRRVKKKQAVYLMFIAGAEALAKIESAIRSCRLEADL